MSLLYRHNFSNKKLLISIHALTASFSYVIAFDAGYKKMEQSLFRVMINKYMTELVSSLQHHQINCLF